MGRLGQDQKTKKVGWVETTGTPSFCKSAGGKDGVANYKLRQPLEGCGLQQVHLPPIYY